MKKILAILTSLSLGSSISSSVIACNGRIDQSDVQFNKSQIKSIIAKIFGKNDYDLSWFDYEDLVNNTDLTSIITSWINEATSLQYGFESENSTLNQLGLNQYDNLTNFNKNEWNKTIENIVSNNLFSNYTTSVSSNQRLDFTEIKSLYSLNVTQAAEYTDFSGNAQSISDDDLKNNSYVIYYDEGKSNDAKLQWQFFNESGDTSIVTTNLPTLEDLTREYSDHTAHFFVGKTGDPNNAVAISSKTALTLRFQDYYENSLKASTWENALSIAYSRSNMYNIRRSSASNKSYDAYMNIASAMYNKAQSWKDSTSDKLSTNAKLVWTFQYDANVADSTINSKLIEKLSGVIDNNGTLVDGASITSIIDIINSATDSNGDALFSTDANETSTDPYFGLSGFKGLTMYDGTAAIGTSPISGEAYETNVENYAYRGGILKNSPFQWETINAKNSNYKEITLILPVYTIELLGGSVDDGTPNYSQYHIKGNDGNDSDKILNLGPSAGSSDQYAKIWNYSINKDLHSFDIQNIAADKVKRDSLLDSIQYNISTDSSVSTIAKTVIYSKYIDVDDIYYSPLYDQIGKYIKSNSVDE